LLCLRLRKGTLYFRKEQEEKGKISFLELFRRERTVWKRRRGKGEREGGRGKEGLYVVKLEGTNRWKNKENENNYFPRRL
jgi:hypothetical protein